MIYLRISLLALLLFAIGCTTSRAQKTNDTQQISQSGMDIAWEHRDGRVYFEISAPTAGWVTIGFNESAGLKGAWLLMGRVVNGKAELVEHHTIGPGNYKPVTELGGTATVQHVSGQESNGTTTLQFSVPARPGGKHQKVLRPGTHYPATIVAYSRHDDFQHHSIMRTTANIKL